MNSDKSEDPQNNSIKRKSDYTIFDNIESKKVCLEQSNHTTDCNSENNRSSNASQDMNEKSSTKSDSQEIESKSSSIKNSDAKISKNITKDNDTIFSKIQIKENNSIEDVESPNSVASNNKELEDLKFQFVVDDERNIEIIPDPHVDYDSEDNNNIIDVFENLVVEHDRYVDSDSPTESVISVLNNNFVDHNATSNKNVQESEYDGDSEGGDNETNKSSEEENVVDKQELVPQRYKCSKCEMESKETCKCTIYPPLDYTTDDETDNTN